MTTYTMTGPDGKDYSIDGPPGATEADVAAQMHAHFGGTAKPEESSGVGGTLIDMARSIPGGLAKGVAAMGGMGGDARSLITSLLPRGARDTVNAAMQPLPQVMLGGKTSNDYNAMFAAPTGGYYDPKTTPGKVAETAASFAPAAVGGEGTIAQRLLGRVVAPAVGSVAGGDIAKAAGAPEQVGDIAGALAGSIIGHDPAAIFRRGGSAIPSALDLKTAARQAYDTVDNSGMVIGAPAMGQMATDLESKLAGLGFHPGLQPKTAVALGAIRDAAGNNQTLKGMDVLKRLANNAVNSTDVANKSDKMMARVIGDHIDDFVGGLQPSQVLGAVDTPALDALSNARNMWSRASKADTIETLIDKARLNSKSMVGNFPALGFGNSLRTVFRQLANNPRGMSRFSSPEQDAIRRVATGGPAENVLRLVGKLAPDQTIPLLSELGIFGASGLDPTTLALPIAGTGAKLAATRITANNARRASELMRSGPQPAATAPSVLKALRSIPPARAAGIAAPAYTASTSPSAEQSALMARQIFGGGATNIPLAGLLQGVR